MRLFQTGYANNHSIRPASSVQEGAFRSSEEIRCLRKNARAVMHSAVPYLLQSVHYKGVMQIAVLANIQIAQLPLHMTMAV